MAENERVHRRNLRMRQLLVELEKSPKALTWTEVWPRIVEAVPLVAEDEATTNTGAYKGENDVRWQTTNMDKAGWLLTGVGGYRVTAPGREALQRYPTADDFGLAAEQAYQQWNALRQPPSDTGMDPKLRVVPTRPGDVLIQLAGRRIFEAGLFAGDSSFAPGVSAWSPDSVEELREAFLEHPDEGKGTFHEKLAGQLQDASDPAILLAAEMLSLIVLPLHDWKADTKRQRVKAVLALMQNPVGMAPDVNAAMEQGAFNGGVAFKTLLWRALATVIEVAVAYWNLTDDERARAQVDPWVWQSLLSELSELTTPSTRAELRYLAFPGTFLPIVKKGHRVAIRDAFAPELGIEKTDVDRDLLAITLALQNRSDAGVNYYLPPLLERWQAPTSGGELVSRRSWLVRGSSVKGIDMVPGWVKGGYVSLAASQLPTLASLDDPQELREAVEDGYAHLSYAKREEKLRDFRSFLTRLAANDLVLTTSGGMVHLGRITGDSKLSQSEDGRSNLRRSVDWQTSGPAIDFADLPAELASRLKSTTDVTDLTDLTALIEALIITDGGGEAEGDDGTSDPLVSSTVTLPDLADEVADELLVARAWLDEMVVVLNERRQVILYGPPGTGKTYLAQKVAESVAPPENVKLVQFHPSYSYEDFFEGYRPVQLDGGQIGLRLKPGPFRRIVDDAREHPDQAFILIIDEINRANLAKVFGELYFLLEYRDSAIDLLYSEDEGQQFQLPRNVFLIGTMNTADRSIALVDSAMRRRFGFLSLHPDDDHMRQMLPQWLANHDAGEEPALLLAELNRRIPDVDFKVGPSYLMNDAVQSPEGLERIWRTAILPLLTEYHAGDDTNVEKRYGLIALRRAVEPEVTEAASVAPAQDVPADAPATPSEA